jgi:hypothetical protein
MNSSLKNSKKSKAAEEHKSCVHVLVAIFKLLSKNEHTSAEFHAIAETLLLVERTGGFEGFMRYSQDYLRSL